MGLNLKYLVKTPPIIFPPDSTQNHWSKNFDFEKQESFKGSVESSPKHPNRSESMKRFLGLGVSGSERLGSGKFGRMESDFSDYAEDEGEQII